MAFVTDSNRHQPLWQPPPTACVTASEAPSDAPSLLMHPRPPPHKHKLQYERWFRELPWAVVSEKLPHVRPLYWAEPSGRNSRLAYAWRMPQLTIRPPSRRSAAARSQVTATPVAGSCTSRPCGPATAEANAAEGRWGLLRTIRRWRYFFRMNVWRRCAHVPRRCTVPLVCHPVTLRMLLANAEAVQGHFVGRRGIEGWGWNQWNRTPDCGW